ncbi:hypothetical protein [Nostoc parmelioides]|uniref:Phenylacetate-CoA ligase n=1 Tax=Nostoc parmelioides FACHB-3921 TaxID=2692909 RepID=A0ABR8BM99_9NOSO|nr:hypothetical protein [Nostoc parmelioides]MBD2255048.1 hypothetical protein [Nostoc parmelioides FACHB-3921]
MTQKFVKTFLGSKETAKAIAQRTQRSVPAYKSFLQKNNLTGEPQFEDLPYLDKNSYILAYPFSELLADDSEEAFEIFRSSGSSGNPFYWLGMKSVSQSYPAVMKTFLESTFAIHQKKTLAIVGLSLSSWMGGEHLSWVLKNVALNTPYPFVVFSPGKQLEEIVQMISHMDSFVEQIIVFIVPSAIAHFHLQAKQLNQSLPWQKIKYVVTGEPFPESLRTSLQNNAEVEEATPFMFSIYGSCDTGSLGVESLATVTLRKLLYRHPNLANSLGMKTPVPHFFHFIDRNAFIETVDGNLCITRWQGIPLVRYILFDQVALYSWKELKQAVLSSQLLNLQDESLVNILANTNDEYPDLIAVTGRSDKCLIIQGTNFTEYMLDAAVKSPELGRYLTGMYHAQISHKEDKHFLQFDLETHQDVNVDETTNISIYYHLVQILGQVQPEFLEDWKSVYSHWDNDPQNRILQLNFISYPGISHLMEKNIKYRSITN